MILFEPRPLTSQFHTISPKTNMRQFVRLLYISNVILTQGFSFQTNFNDKINKKSNLESQGFSSVRRNLITASPISVFLISQIQKPSNLAVDNLKTSQIIEKITSVSDAVSLIEKSCNRNFFHGVVASGYNFLYRGIPTPDMPQSMIRLEESDLLDPNTYNSKDASDFFNKLEVETLRESPVKPSNGHLAVTCPRAASEWGIAASIWPLGEDVHFAWFENGGKFWPREKVDDKIIVDGIDCGQQALEDALMGDNLEVMFSSNRFLAVPLSMEEELRNELKKSFIL